MENTYKELTKEQELRLAKEEAELASLQLYYPDVVREKIFAAENVAQVENIMVDARKGKWSKLPFGGNYYFHHNVYDIEGMPVKKVS